MPSKQRKRTYTSVIVRRMSVLHPYSPPPMPDTPTAFRLPRPLQPASHHALGLHNAPVYEYDLLEYTGENGRPLVVVEPRRADGQPQGPFTWFGRRIVEAVNETYGGAAMIVVRDRKADGTEVWCVTRDMPIPTFDEKDPATAAVLQSIQAQVQSGGLSPEQAIERAVKAGALKPSGMEMHKALVEIVPKAVPRVLAGLFAHHVEPAEAAEAASRPGIVASIGFAAAADARPARRARPRRGSLMTASGTALA